MEILKDSRFVERLRFFDGQRLLASDLQGVEAFNREMRWLHNKSLHQPGIGNGFAVSGKKGDREVRVGPGYAIDAEGREIILLRDHIEMIPPVAGNADGTPMVFDLTVLYPSDEDLEEAERRQGICDQSGTVRLKEEPVFCWVELNANLQPKDTKVKQEILAGMRLVLARAEVLNCQLYKDISIAQRLSARPPSQPYICCGSEIPKWQPWILATLDPAKMFSDDEGQLLARMFGSALTFFPFILPIGLTAVIDTSQCGFITTPCYSARISGPRVRRAEGTGRRKASVAFLIDGLVQIVDPQPDQFTINVLLLGQVLAATEEDKRALAAVVLQAVKIATAFDTKSADFKDRLEEFTAEFFKDWQVVWMGIEE